MKAGLPTIVFQFCLCYCPAMLFDEDAYEALLAFVDALVGETVLKERLAAASRLLTPSLS